MKIEGIEGKTFLEVGCGPCPIGQRLASLGAKKIYGVDISEEMITASKENLEKMGIADQFHLVCADVFDENFHLPEEVDCVVLSYTLSTFIHSYDQLCRLLTQCRKQVKNDGYLMIADFCWVKMPCDGFWGGMYTNHPDENGPKPFETFDFFIDRAPESPFKIFNIPAEIMFKAGFQTGLKHIEYKPQYPDPKFKDDPAVRRYLDECNPSDYIMKYRYFLMCDK